MSTIFLPSHLAGEAIVEFSPRDLGRDGNMMLGRLFANHYWTELADEIIAKSKDAGELAVAKMLKEKGAPYVLDTRYRLAAISRMRGALAMVAPAGGLAPAISAQNSGNAPGVSNGADLLKDRIIDVDPRDTGVTGNQLLGELDAVSHWKHLLEAELRDTMHPENKRAARVLIETANEYVARIRFQMGNIPRFQRAVELLRPNDMDLPDGNLTRAN